jgi:hypothetical protein
MAGLTNKEYILRIDAYDTLGTIASLNFRLVAAIWPPADAPQITLPHSGALINQSAVSLVFLISPRFRDSLQRSSEYYRCF